MDMMQNLIRECEADREEERQRREEKRKKLKRKKIVRTATSDSPIS